MAQIELGNIKIEVEQKSPRKTKVKKNSSSKVGKKSQKSPSKIQSQKQIVIF